MTKKPEYQKVNVPTFNQPNDTYKDMTEEVKSILANGEDVKININHQDMSIIEFVMYVENIAQKSKRVLSPLEMEILNMFLDIMKKHAVVVGQELYRALKRGGKV